jgi:hypothetical protein
MELCMTNNRISMSVLWGLALVLAGSMLSGCVVETPGGYRDGYYDRDHHRYWHEHRWHECHERDEHCR